MKNLFTLLFLLLTCLVFAQQKTILLADGSTIYGEITGVDSVSGQTLVRLSDQTEIRLSSKNIQSIERVTQSFWTFNNGYKLLEKGRYTSFAFHVLSAETDLFFETQKRWNLGGHVTKGYQFNQFFALGAGTGLDLNREFLMPVFIEIKGALTGALGFSMKHREGPGYRLPLTYGLQLGYNLPVGDFFKKDNELDIYGGLLVYPHIGFSFPTRTNAKLVLDAGYKFQRYAKETTDWNQYRSVETYTLKSFAVRAGVVF